MGGVRQSRGQHATPRATRNTAGKVRASQISSDAFVLSTAVDFSAPQAVAERGNAARFPSVSGHAHLPVARAPSKKSGTLLSAWYRDSMAARFREWRMTRTWCRVRSALPMKVPPTADNAAGPPRPAGRVATTALHCVLALAAAVAAPAITHAGGWPQPAAGRSASKGPELLLTFDDGPNPKTTPRVLDILKARKISAVFFIVGEMVHNNPKGAALIRRIEAEGHIVANHTMTHQDLCRVKEERAASEIDRGREAIASAALTPVLWFRTPYGAKCKRLEDMLAARNLHHFHWDLDPQEWKNRSADKTYAYVTGQLSHASDRYVLLLHDIHETTVEALPRILDWIDEENRGRLEIGKKPIRILPAWEVAREKLGKATWAWLVDTAAAADLRPQLASILP